jgi:hypothetical protein
MHILGLDFATKTGVAFGQAGAPAARIQTETWSLPGGGGEDVGAFMHALRTKLDERMAQGVECVVFEAPYIARHKGQDGRWHESPDQIRRAFGAAAVCEEIAFARGIPVYEIVTVTLKKQFGGSGRTDKAGMIAAAKRRGFTVANDHEADACGCFHHGVVTQTPQFAHVYDPLFTRLKGKVTA